MDNSENIADALTIGASIKKGTRNITENFRVVARALLPVSVAMAVVAMAAFGGNVGEVKTNYITYMPFHEISMALFLRYAAGCVLLAVLFMLWKGVVFAIIGGEKKLSVKDKMFAGLKFAQFCLLSVLAFGIIGAALVVVSVKVSAFVWIAIAVYLIVIAVPLYIAEYEYMLTDNNFRKSLCKGFKAMKEQWGRVFFRLLVANAVAVLLVVVALLPALALLLGIYDNATAVSLTGAQKTPLLIYIAEYLFIGLGMLATLCVAFGAVSAKKAFFEEAAANASFLAEGKTEE